MYSFAALSLPAQIQTGALRLMSWLILIVGLYLCFRIRFFQIRRIGLWLRVSLIDPLRAPRSALGENPLKAAFAALSGTIGTGNMAGVACAVSLGGAGAVLWMWLSSLVGMAIKFSEIVLALTFRKNGEGGASLYLRKARFGRVLAPVFTALALVTGLLMGNMVQSNTAAAAVTLALPNVPPLAVGAFMALLCVLLSNRGMRGFTRLSGTLMPILCLVYIGTALYIMILNADALLPALAAMLKGAFSATAAAGGAAGYGVSAALRQGVGRGVFSNEAGLGVSPLAHATSSEKEPVRQGMLGIFEVFMDTSVLCTLTALALLVSYRGEACPLGIAAVAYAWQSAFGRMGTYIIAFLVAAFGFTTMLAWSNYVNILAKHLFKPHICALLAPLFPMLILFGSILEVDAVWQFADVANVLTCLPNLIGLVLLAPVVAQSTRRYEKSLYHEK